MKTNPLPTWIKTGARALRAFWLEEEGQDLVEYSLLIACLALATVGMITDVKVETKDIWSTLNSTLISGSSAAS